MVYLNLPTGLTEEEKMLKKKYDFLRHLRNQQKTPKLEPPPVKSVKRPLEPRPDAKEVAKKLLKSGAISAIKPENKETQGFKRSKASGRKSSSGQRICTTPDSFGRSRVSDTDNISYSTSRKLDARPSFGSPSDSFSPRPFVKKLHESFVSSGNLQDEIKKNFSPRSQYREQKRNDWEEQPHQGNTVYVRGHGITQELLQKKFEHIGNIIKITMKPNCSFVTFEKNAQAEKAIEEFNGTVCNDVQLYVSIARRQFILTSLDD